MSDTQVLDLDAAFERDEVKLNDKKYLLRNQQEFSILQWHQIVSLDDQAKRLAKTAGSSEANAKKLSSMQRDLAAMLIVDLDPQDEIPDWACAAILRFWAERVNAKADKGDDGDPPKGRRTTGSSSRGSKRSTAATRKTGSSKSQAGS